MARLHFGRWTCLIATIALSLLLPACGGKKSSPPASGIPARIALNPNPSFSIQAGIAMQLTASATNSANANLNAVFIFNSSNPSILDISPTGYACAGTWNAPAYTVCSPGPEGTVQVTASAFGVTSPPTLFFVHPPIASIQISIVPPVNSLPPACPSQQLPLACNLPFNSNTGTQCLSQNSLETLQATAYDAAGNDMTAQVGPFTWTESTVNAVKITPIVTVTNYNVPTNQATVNSGTPGQVQIVASASGAFSQPFNIESCPVQCIALVLGVSGQQQGTTTNFVVNKGTAEVVTAYAVDVQGCIVPTPGLTWSSSEPAALSVGSSCANSTTCSVSTPQPGAGSITATCTPPACNVGFPLNPANLKAPYVPQPLYPVTAISGIVTGAPSTASVLATSQDCYSEELCSVGIYNVSSTTNLPSAGFQLPTSPNSLMYDPAGDKAYIGSQFGAFTANPSNFGTSSSAFTPLAAPGTPLGLVTGKVLAVSPNGNSAIFSDTVSTPNQVYVVNTAPASTVPLDLNGAIAAAFSPDGLEAYILADGGTSLYSYSTLQFLQPVNVPLPTPATQIVFNGSGTFALLAGGGSAGNFAAYNTCDNLPISPSLSMGAALTSPPQFLTMVPGGNIPLGGLFGNVPIPSDLNTVGLDFFIGLDNVGNGASTGIDVIATNTSFFPLPYYSSLCPLPVAIASTTASVPFPPFHVAINQGTFHPIAFFVAPSATQAYIVTSDQGVLVYNFNAASVVGIKLVNNASPIAASITVDGTYIYVAGSDGLLHQLNTALQGDEFQTAFTPLPNSSNSFCFTGNNCTFNLLAVKP
jgi:hypothetical protein